MKICWIHLSDLHIKRFDEIKSKHENITREYLYKQLINDICERKRIHKKLNNLNYLFITGDLVDKGSDYESFLEDFYSPLMEKINPKGFLILTVPGNHDVEIADIEQGKKFCSKNIVNQSQVDNILTNTGNIYDNYFNRQKKYFAFWNEHIKPNLNDKINDFRYCYLFNDNNVSILCLNSSWSFGDCSKQENEKTNDDMMVLGKTQLTMLLNEIEQSHENCIIISLLHHDFHSFKSFDIENTIKPLIEVSDFILHGHRHTTSLSHDQISDTRVISPSSCSTQGENSIGYYYGVIDTTNKIINYYFRTFKYPRFLQTTETREFKIDGQLLTKINSIKYKSKGASSIPVHYCMKKSNDSSEQNVKEYFQESKNLFDKHDYRGCILQLNRILNIDSKNSKALNNRGLCNFLLGYLKTAEEDYNAAIVIDHTFSEAYFNRAILKTDQNKINNAIKDYNLSIKFNKLNYKAYNNLGILFRKNKLYREAFNNYTKAILSNALSYEAYNNIGNLKIDMKKYKDAIDDFTKALEIKSDYCVAFCNRGLAKLELYKNETTQILEKCLLKSAEEDFSQAINLNEYYFEAYAGRGLVFKEMKKYDLAIEDFNSSLKINPYSLEALNNRGIVKRLINNYDDAILDYTNSIAINSKNPDAYYNRGITRIKQKDYKNAVDDFNFAIKRKKRFFQAYAYRGMVYAYLGNYAKSFIDFNNAIKINPKYIDTYNNRIDLHLKLKHFNKAIKDCNKVLSIKSNDPIAYINRSQAYWYLGEKILSKKDYLEAKKIATQEGLNYAIKELETVFDKDGNVNSQM